MITSALSSLVILFAAVTAPLADPAEEARAQKLMREIRCVACENEPISQSGSAIAIDMQARVRQLVESGASDQEIRAQFAALYGERVLFRPQVRSAADYLLWGAPFGIVLLGGLGIVLVARRKTATDDVQAVAPSAYEDAP